MIAKNTVLHSGCMACLHVESEKKVVDAFFENGNFVVLSRCQACDGITKIVYQAHSHQYISGPRRSLYPGIQVAREERENA